MGISLAVFGVLCCLSAVVATNHRAGKVATGVAWLVCQFSGFVFLGLLALRSF